MQVNVKFAFSMLAFLSNHDLVQMGDAIKAHYGQIPVDEELRTIKWKPGKKDQPHEATLKLGDKSKVKMILADSPAAAFYAVNLTLLEMESCGQFLKLAELPIGISRWVAKFELTETVKTERARKLALQAKLDAASAELRAKMIAEAETANTEA